MLACITMHNMIVEEEFVEEDFVEGIEEEFLASCNLVGQSFVIQLCVINYQL